MIRTVHPYLVPLRELFADAADPVIAQGQQAYMKNKFPFFGIKTDNRRAIIRGFLKVHGRPDMAALDPIIRSAWSMSEREMHYFGMELFTAFASRLGPEHLGLAEYMIQQKSWWDTVDHIAVHGVGRILSAHREIMAPTNERYMASGELWLLRTALIFQLQYKDKTDRNLLFGNIERLATHPDFFIRKGIGWALRQYARTEPGQVRAFVQRTELSPLSVREATKHLQV